jgi:hypothetical protein
MRPEVWEAFRQIRSALSTGTFADRSATLDEARSKPYYSTTIEKAARAFERYTVQRLAGLDISNDYLVNITKDFSPALPTPEEMDGGIRQAFDHLFNTLDTVETAKGVRLFSSPAPEDLRQQRRFLEGPAVTKLDGSEFASDGTPLTDKVADYYQRIGKATVMIDGIGKVQLDRRFVQEEGDGICGSARGA